MIAEKVNFYRCNVCNKIVEVIDDSAGSLVCCKEPAQQLIANTTNASFEKHVPVITKEDGKIVVTIGAEQHPMSCEHYIEWVCIVFDNRVNRFIFKPNDKPQAIFCAKNALDVTVYAYCNLHGLWKALN